jgi:hypothetical protein
LLPTDLPLLLEDVGAGYRLDSWSGQNPFRRKRSALSVPFHVVLELQFTTPLFHTTAKLTEAPLACPIIL